MTPRSSAGTVVDFDVHRGLGVLEEHTGRRLPFHCTAIADGSRSIAVGTPTAFEVVPGVGGAWEAANIRALVT